MKYQLNTSRRIKIRQGSEILQKPFKNFDALQTLQEGKMLHGFFMTSLKKFQVKPDPVRVDDNWEGWSI